MNAFFLDLYCSVFSLFMKRDDSTRRRIRAEGVCIVTVFLFLLNVSWLVLFLTHYDPLGALPKGWAGEYILGFSLLIVGFVITGWFGRHHPTLREPDRMLDHSRALTGGRKRFLAMVVAGNLVLFLV